MIERGCPEGMARATRVYTRWDTIGCSEVAPWCASRHGERDDLRSTMPCAYGMLCSHPWAVYPASWSGQRVTDSVFESADRSADRRPLDEGVHARRPVQREASRAATVLAANLRRCWDVL